MSTAFRNFIITFALAAVLFGVIGYMAVNGILDGLFKGSTSTSEDTTEYSYENAESYYNGEYDGSDEIIPSTEEFAEVYMVFFEDHMNELVGSKIICVNEKSGKMIFENMPINSTIVVNGYNRTVKEIYKSNGEEYLCGKLQYVLGVGVKSYVVFSLDAMKELFVETKLGEEYNVEIKCDLPYEVKYEDPEMKDYNEQNPDDIQYVTLAGEVVLSPENAPYIFENIPEDSIDSKAASVMFGQIYESVFSKFFSNNELKEKSGSVKEFFKCFKKCSVDDESYSVFFGVYDGMYQVSGSSDISAMAGKELNWSMLPAILESALK